MDNGHLKTGERGEAAAARFMEERGYLVIQRNWRSGKAEVDLICGSGEELVFVEVKTRSSDYFGDPECFVTPHKQRMMKKAAHSFLENLGSSFSLRFDIISVKISGSLMEIRHFENAFGESTEVWK